MILQRKHCHRDLVQRIRSVWVLWIKSYKNCKERDQELGENLREIKFMPYADVFDSM